ncbi:hypothetical protein BpHYR1_009842 [Brachionus plicatilis]|uniref:SWIM-type domain-containing protein n=1 Tax=Brachionus plicatilis TaxID=10195 RepID=A0A3M7SVB0_BRAPC|nr:hypothetical protein BpHYR1_009842 [Brachionus plicatilis]
MPKKIFGIFEELPTTRMLNRKRVNVDVECNTCSCVKYLDIETCPHLIAALICLKKKYPGLKLKDDEFLDFNLICLLSTFFGLTLTEKNNLSLIFLA